MSDSLIVLVVSCSLVFLAATPSLIMEEQMAQFMANQQQQMAWMQQQIVNIRQVAPSSSLQPHLQLPGPYLPTYQPAYQPPGTSQPSLLECKVPVMTNVHKQLSLGQAKSILMKQENFITDTKLMYKAKPGDVWYFRTLDENLIDDWKVVGHNFRLQSGAPANRLEEFKNLERKTAYIVTKEKPKGDKNFIRISWKLKTRALDTLIQYIGDDTLSVDFINGNSKHNKQPRMMIKPSLKTHVASSPLKASALTEQLVLGAGPDKVSQLLDTPANHRQVRQLQLNSRRREEKVDIYAELLRLAYELPCIRLLTFAPRLLLVVCDTEMIKYVRDVLKEVPWEGSGEQCVAYDTQFNLGPYYVSTLTLRDPRRERKSTMVIPIVPFAMCIHDRKFKWDHNLFMTVITDLVPELKTTMFVSSSDDEFTPLLIKSFPKSFVTKDENHLVKKIGRAVEKKGGNQKEISFYKNEFRKLIRCETKEQYKQELGERKKLWREDITKYMEKFILPHVDRSALWTAREIGWLRAQDNIPDYKKKEVIFDSQQAECFNATFKKRCGGKELSLPEMVHVWGKTQRAYLSEVGRSLMGNMGEFRMRELFIKTGDEKRGEDLLTAVRGPLEHRGEDSEEAGEMFERIEVDDETIMEGRVQDEIIMDGRVQDEIIRESRVQDEIIMESRMQVESNQENRESGMQNRVLDNSVMESRVQEEELSLAFISPSSLVVPEMSSQSMDGYESPSPIRNQKLVASRSRSRKTSTPVRVKSSIFTSRSRSRSRSRSSSMSSLEELPAPVRKPVASSSEESPSPLGNVKRLVREADVLGVQSYIDAGFDDSSLASNLQDKSPSLPPSTSLATALSIPSPRPVLTRSAKRSLTFGEPHNNTDLHLDISGDDSMTDQNYVPEEHVEDAEEMEYLEVEKETHNIVAKDQANDHDPHPSLMKIGTGLYEVAGKSMPFYVKPHQNLCTGCKVKTKSKWCKHLISAGLREGLTHKGPVYKQSIEQLVRGQNEGKRKSGSKCPRSYDYRPAPNAVEAFSLDCIEEENSLEVRVQKKRKTEISHRSNVKKSKNDVVAKSVAKPLPSGKICNNCEQISCKPGNCNQCKFCLDKVYNGGKNILKRGCKTKICSNPSPVAATLPTSPRAQQQVSTSERTLSLRSRRAPGQFIK